jgi:hypothetical protein
MRPVLILSLFSFSGASVLMAQVPLMSHVVPDSGKIGSVLKIEGIYLDKTKVDEVYLSDHTFDMKVKVLGQTDHSIEIRIPPFAKPGRLQLVVKTTGNDPEILEQPVYVTVEDPNQTLQANAAARPPSGGTKR